MELQEDTTPRVSRDGLRAGQWVTPLVGGVFDAGPEALSLLELRAPFKGLPLRGSFSTPLRNADELDLRVGFDVLIAEKASVRTVPSGSPTESFLMTLQ